MENLIIDFAQLGKAQQQYIIDKSASYRRVYIKNAGYHGVPSILVIDAGVQLHSEQPVFVSHAERLEIKGIGFGKNRGTIVGGLQVAGDIKQLIIKNMIFLNGEHGLLMSQHTGQEFYGMILIEDSLFYGCEKEGIYIGHHAAQAPKIQGVSLIRVEAHGCGWDGIQVGNTKRVTLDRCKAYCNALDEEYGQDFNLTINPGVDRIDIKDCHFDNSIQFPGQQIFFYNQTQI